MLQNDFFNDTFVSQLPDDTDAAIVLIADEYDRLFTSHSQNVRLHRDFIEAFALIEAFLASREFETRWGFDPANLDKTNLRNALAALREQAKAQIGRRNTEEFIAAKREEYAARFARVPFYEFSDADYGRIQELITEIRDHLSRSKLIPDTHRRRLLDRLEGLQAELHKRNTRIERFWAFIGEASIVVRKFGDDLKPISDRVVEIGRIVIRVILIAEGIEALPMLSNVATSALPDVRPPDDDAKHIDTVAGG